MNSVLQRLYNYPIKTDHVKIFNEENRTTMTILNTEATHVIRILNIGQLSGIDNISGELIKGVAETLYILTKLCQNI